MFVSNSDVLLFPASLILKPSSPVVLRRTETAERLESHIWSHIFDSERYVDDSLNYSVTSVCLLNKVLT